MRNVCVQSRLTEVKKNVYFRLIKRKTACSSEATAAIRLLPILITFNGIDKSLHGLYFVENTKSILLPKN